MKLFEEEGNMTKTGVVFTISIILTMMLFGEIQYTMSENLVIFGFTVLGMLVGIEFEKRDKYKNK